MNDDIQLLSDFRLDLFCENSQILGMTGETKYKINCMLHKQKSTTLLQLVEGLILLQVFLNRDFFFQFLYLFITN